MANLALKAVMWGADKIPDSVFEALPGGFFKPKDDQNRKHRSGDHDKRRRDSKRYSDDDDDRRRHRHGHHSHRNDHGGRHRSRSRRRRSYEDSDDDLSDAPSRGRGDSQHRRRHSYEDYNDAGRYRREDEYDDRRPHEWDRDRDRDRDHDHGSVRARPPYPESNGETHRFDHDPFAPGGKATTAAAAAGAAAATAPRAHDMDYRSSPSESPVSNSSGQVYIPYSNIYGQSAHQPASRPSGPRGAGNEQSMPLVARPPYGQNPRAQDSASDSQPSYVVPSDDYDPRHDPHYYDPPAHDDGYTDYTSRPGSTYAPSRSRSRRGRAYSPSYVSYDSRYDDDSRRTRSERRSDKKTDRSKSKIREAFDPSQRGIGYGAVGALAGGLVGSEVGKGPLPAIIGAVIGGAGTNAFQAREKRKEAKRQERYISDGMYGRRNGRMTRMDSEGYYSD